MNFVVFFMMSLIFFLDVDCMNVPNVDFDNQIVSVFVNRNWPNRILSQDRLAEESVNYPSKRVPPLNENVNMQEAQNFGNVVVYPIDLEEIPSKTSEEKSIQTEDEFLSSLRVDQMNADQLYELIQTRKAENWQLEFILAQLISK